MVEKTKGFTLVEILVSTVIIAIISVGTYITFFVLSESAQASQNQLYAITLAQGVLEDVRLKAKNNFDGLEREVFVDIDQKKYPTFYRLPPSISPISSLNKKVDITIGWTERGQPRQYHLSLFISRSSEPLPANIRGTITNSKTGAAVQNAIVTATYVTNPNLYYTFLLTPQRNGKYHFLDSADNFQLKAGDWRLKVIAAPGYYDSPEISVTNLSSGEDRIVDVKLDPRPEPAYIRGKVVDAANGNRLITSGSVYVSLYEKGARQSYVYCNNNRNGFKFTIPFDKTDPRSFTIVTSYRGYDDSTYLSWYCGNIPGVGDSKGKSYNHRGWSSAVVREDGTFNLSNPWYGDKDTDRITVEPGDDKDIGMIPLVPVPLATVNGNVYDSLGNTVSYATVRLAWHTGELIHNIRTDTKGFYERQVPAEQELFPDSFQLRLYAEGNTPVVGSCGISTTAGVNTGWMTLAEPLYAGNTLTHNFHLPGATPARYGNAEGYVKDGQSGEPIRSAFVNIWSWAFTDASGKYEFKCDPDHAAYFKIPEEAYLVSVRKSGYYDFRNDGGLSTVYSVRPKIYISPEQTTAYEDVRLWPIGPRGRIHGKVVDISDGTTVIENARVRLTGRGQDRTETTGSDGEFGFPKNKNSSSWYLYETLPAPAAKGDPYYNKQPQNYSLTVTDSRYEDYTVSNIILDAGVDKDLVVQLTKKPGM